MVCNAGRAEGGVQMLTELKGCADADRDEGLDKMRKDDHGVRVHEEEGGGGGDNSRDGPCSEVQ